MIIAEYLTTEYSLQNGGREPRPTDFPSLVKFPGDAVRKEMIDAYTASLKASLGSNHQIADHRALRQLFKARDYEGMIGFVRDTMNLDLRVRLGIVNSGGPQNAPAWIRMSSAISRPGTSAFKHELVTVFLRRSFLEESTYEQVAIAIAHEFSHVVLNSIHHDLREREPAVDLTAMLLGYRDLYVTGCSTLRVERGLNWRRETRHSFGYLSKDEVEYAAERMGYTSPWWRSRIVRTLQPFFLPPGLFAIVLAFLVSQDRSAQLQIRRFWRSVIGSELFVPMMILLAFVALITAVNLIKKTRQKTQRRRRAGHTEQMGSNTFRPKDDPNAETKRRFNAVFALIDGDRRQALIDYYKRKHGCDTTEAMQKAIDDLNNEEVRYR
jgi:hypothetical protein